MIALLVMTDGRRECLAATMASHMAELRPWAQISEVWIHEDSGDADYRRWLAEVYPTARIIGPEVGAGRSGFGGAIRRAWSTLRQHSAARFVYHLEDDFTLTRPLDLLDMAMTLEENPHLVQLALRRQPWSAAEVAAGGIVEQHPTDYVDCVGWLEHRRFFTTNPSLYRRSLLVEHEWPDGAESEGRFGIALLERHPDWRFAYWGRRGDPPWCHHIGAQRVGTGY